MNLDFLADDDSKRHYQDLVHHTARGQGVAFVGAGLSIDGGFRLWKDALLGTKDSQGNVTKTGFVHHANLTAVEIDNFLTDLPALAECCATKGGVEIYRRFIESEYGRKSPKHSSIVHRNIWETNFAHVLTTNYDPLLFDESDWVCKQMVTVFMNYLELDERRTLYHIHGRAFREDSDKRPLADYIDRLVYTKSQYERAYRSTHEIKTFLHSLIKKYCIVFMGFSLRDQDFKETFSAVQEAKAELDSVMRLGTEPGNYSILPQFIFVEYPQESLYTIPEEQKRELAGFQGVKQALESMGLNVIAYLPQNSTHEGLKRAISELRNNAQLPRMPRERTKAIDVIERASVSGA